MNASYSPIRSFKGLAIVACLGMILLTGGQQSAWALGDDLVKPCPRGEVRDPKTSKCIKAQSGILPDDALVKNAYALAKSRRYQEAIAVLDMMKRPNTPEALNYRGFATRKIGRVDEGIGYYLKSIALDPNYPLVREYLGEAYITKGKFDQAQRQLKEIKRICGTDCRSYKTLANAIANPATIRY
ncbi:MAG: tetratricopeptide repeat protein [Hyphomicrobiales bacterium]|nr:tetratricopeptide repeat protein [Hyphomicrobiales bacterium]